MILQVSRDITSIWVFSFVMKYCIPQIIISILQEQGKEEYEKEADENEEQEEEDEKENEDEEEEKDAIRVRIEE